MLVSVTAMNAVSFCADCLPVHGRLQERPTRDPRVLRQLWQWLPTLHLPISAGASWPAKRVTGQSHWAITGVPWSWRLAIHR